MTVYGYARVSTKYQSIERQTQNIQKVAPNAKMYSEYFTGTKIDRPQFSRLLKTVKEGDTIVFDSVSRMARNADEGFRLFEELYENGVDLVFLKEPYINTENYRQAMHISLPEVADDTFLPLMDGLKKTLLLLAKKQFRQAFEQAEKEVKDIQQRTREGMKVSGAGAKISKANTGKKYKIKKRATLLRNIEMFSKSFDGNMKDKELLEQDIIHCSPHTYYKYKKMVKEMRIVKAYSESYGGTCSDAELLEILGCDQETLDDYKEMIDEGSGVSKKRQASKKKGD